MIQIHKLFKKYGDRIIFENVCCLLENQHIYGLAGANGIGKTTLLNAVAQPENIDAGVVKIDGIDSRMFASKFHLFYIPDNKEMFLNLSGREYLKFMVKIYRQDEKNAAGRLKKLSAAFGMEQSLNERMDNYSLGMKQKVYLIASFLSGAGNLILDEPFNGLDPQSAAVLKQLLIEHRNAGNLVLLSIHEPDLASKLCDDVLFIGRHRNIVLFDQLDHV